MKRHTAQKTGALLTPCAALVFGLMSAQAQGGFPPGGPLGAQMGGMQNRPNMQNLTQEQRQTMSQQMGERNVRSTLQNAGLTDTKIQDIIVAFASAQSAARQPIQEGVRQVMQQMSAGKLTGAQVNDTLVKLNTALNAEKLRAASAVRQLDTQIGYSKNPRLELLLTMMGLVGESSFLSSSGGRPNGPGMMGGMGGPGGGQGGPGG